MWSDIYPIAYCSFIYIYISRVLLIWQNAMQEGTQKSREFNPEGHVIALHRINDCIEIKVTSEDYSYLL